MLSKTSCLSLLNPWASQLTQSHICSSILYKGTFKTHGLLDCLLYIVHSLGRTVCTHRADCGKCCFAILSPPLCQCLHGKCIPPFVVTSSREDWILRTHDRLLFGSHETSPIARPNQRYSAVMAGERRGKDDRKQINWPRCYTART